MKWSFQVANIAGIPIPIRVHITSFLILLLGAYQWFSLAGTLNGAVFGVALMGLLFVCATLHELGHSLVARAFGVPVREIVRLPLGGLAQNAGNAKPVCQDPVELVKLKF